MNKVEARASVFLLALQSLSKADRKAVIARLLEDPKLREDILDLAVFRQRRDEPSRLFRDYLSERQRKATKD